jgi:hypothetical protein
MSERIFESVLKQGDLITILTIRDISYDMVEVTFKRDLKAENGKPIVDNKYTMFYTKKEFEQVFLPLINTLKVRFDNANDATQPNT